jgi:4-oxalomesaconate tautomerase
LSTIPTVRQTPLVTESADHDPFAAGVRCMLMRGGTSKGGFFVADDLPGDAGARDDVLLRLMGSPDPRQIDGLGGAHPLTTKVAIVSRSARDGVDLDYLFLQPSVEQAQISDRQNCGNMLAAVGPFAVERHLVPIAEGATTVSCRIYMENTDSVVTATFPVDGGMPDYAGRSVAAEPTSIDGVPGTAAAITLDFEDIAGGSCGALLPTGNVVDEIDGIECTLIDNGMPVVVLRAADLGVAGTESPAELEANDALRSRLEAIRLLAGPMMHLGDVTDTTVPKLTMVSTPVAGGHLNTRTFIPHRCHEAIGVLGAVSVATAARLPGSPAAEVARLDGATVVCEHPSGSFAASVVVEIGEDGAVTVERAGIVRTARKLMDGRAYPREY